MNDMMKPIVMYSFGLSLRFRNTSFMKDAIRYVIAMKPTKRKINAILRSRNTAMLFFLLHDKLQLVIYHLF
jgi:hypothetical protein